MGDDFDSFVGWRAARCGGSPRCSDCGASWFVEWASLLVFYISAGRQDAYPTHIHSLIQQCRKINYIFLNQDRI